MTSLTRNSLVAIAFAATMAGCAAKKPVATDDAVVPPAAAETPAEEQAATTAGAEGAAVSGTDIGAAGGSAAAAGTGAPTDGQAGAGLAGGGDSLAAASGDGFESNADNYTGDTRTRVLYFGFDRAEIPAVAYGTLKAHARHLAANPGAMLRLEGHADERGTPEYNVALAERRGKSVQQFLVLNGARAAQLEVISYGEEKPAVLGSDELSWAKNRRVEFVYSAGQP